MHERRVNDSFVLVGPAILEAEVHIVLAIRIDLIDIVLGGESAVGDVKLCGLHHVLCLDVVGYQRIGLHPIFHMPVLFEIIFVGPLGLIPICHDVVFQKYDLLVVSSDHT